MPTRTGFLQAVDNIDNIDDADDSAELEVLRNNYAVIFFYTTQVGLEGGLRRSRMN